jgi:hypothetical protein
VQVPPPFHPAVPSVPEVAAILAEKGLVLQRCGSPSVSAPCSPTMSPKPSLLSKKRSSSMSDDDDGAVSPARLDFDLELDEEDGDIDADADSDAYVSDASRNSKRRAVSGSMDSCDSEQSTESDGGLAFLSSESECMSEGSPAVSAACVSDFIFGDEGDDVLSLLAGGRAPPGSSLPMPDFELPVYLVEPATFVDDFNWFTATVTGRPASAALF